MGKDKKNPPGGHDTTPMPPSVGETYTLKLTFHGATNLPAADWGDSADPFVLAQVNTPLHTRNKHDPRVRFRSATSYKTLDPRWEAVWVVAGVPAAGAEFKIRVYDEDSGSHDDELGKIHLHTGRLGPEYAGLRRQTFELSSRGASVKAWGRKAVRKPFSAEARKDSTITVSVESLGRTDPEVAKVYTANSFYWVHFSTLLGKITDTVAPDPDEGGHEDADFQANELQLAGPAPNALYHRYVEFLPFVKTMFQAKHLRGKAMHELLHREHEKVYHFDPRTRYGRLRNGHERARRFLDMAHWGEGDRVFTYVVTLDGLMRFTETGPEFNIDMLSKHTMHSDVNEWICVSGEFFVRKFNRGDPDGNMVKGVTSGDDAKGVKPSVERDIQQLEINTQYDGGDGDGGNGREGEERPPMEVKSPSEAGMPSRRPARKRQDTMQSGYYTPPEEYEDKPAVVAAVGGHRRAPSGTAQDRRTSGGFAQGTSPDAASQRTITRDAPAPTSPTSPTSVRNNAGVQNSVRPDGPNGPNGPNGSFAGPASPTARAASGTATPAAYHAQPGSGALVGPPVPHAATGPDGMPTSGALGVFGGAPADGGGLKGRRGYIATRTVETELPSGRRIVETSRVEVVHRRGEAPQEHREFERHEISPQPRALPLPPDGKPDGPLSPQSRKVSLPAAGVAGAAGDSAVASPLMSPGLSGMGSPALSAVAPITIASAVTTGNEAHIEEINDDGDDAGTGAKGVKGVDGALGTDARIRDPKQSARVNRPPSHASVHGSMHESMYAGDNRVSGASFDRPSGDARRQSTDRRQSSDGKRRSSDRRRSGPSSPVQAMTPANGDGAGERPKSLGGPEHHYAHADSDGSSVEEAQDAHLHDMHLDVNGHPQSAFREDGDVLLAQQQQKPKHPLLGMRLDKQAARHQRNQPPKAAPLPAQQQSSVRVPLTAEALQHHNSVSSKKGSPTSPANKSSPRKSPTKAKRASAPPTDAEIKASLIPAAPASKPSGGGGGGYKVVDNPRYATDKPASPVKEKTGPQEHPLLGSGGAPIGRVAEQPPQLSTLSLNEVGPEFVERDPHGLTVGVLTGPAVPSALELSDSDDDIPQGGLLVYTNERDGKPVEADPYGEKARKRAEAARAAAAEAERQRQEDARAAEEAAKQRQRDEKRGRKEQEREDKERRKEEKRQRKERERRDKDERKQRERDDRDRRDREDRARREQHDAVARDTQQTQREAQEKDRAADAMRRSGSADVPRGSTSAEKPRGDAKPPQSSPPDTRAGVAGAHGTHTTHGTHGKPTASRHASSARKEKHVTPVETNWILGPESGGSTDPADYQLIIDNDSGTYRPDKQLMPLFEAWLRQELPGLHVMAMSCDDDRLQSMKKKRQERKKERNKGRFFARPGSHGSMSSFSSSDEEDIKQGRAPIGKTEKGFDFLEHPGQTLKSHLHHGGGGKDK